MRGVTPGVVFAAVVHFSVRIVEVCRGGGGGHGWKGALRAAGASTFAVNEERQVP